MKKPANKSSTKISILPPAALASVIGGAREPGSGVSTGVQSPRDPASGQATGVAVPHDVLSGLPLP